MELVFFYPCPYCERNVPLVSPVKPIMAVCDVCGKSFPVAPIDHLTVRFVKAILAGGKAGIDPDFF